MAISPKPGRGAIRPPAVRLAPRDELAAAARVAPLLRAARDLARWVAVRPGLSPDDAASAAVDLGLTPEEVEAAWQVATGARMLGEEDSSQRTDILAAGDPEAVLTLWDDALSATLRTTELEGLVTALYTAGSPVRIDALFEAYLAARQQVPPGQGEAGTGVVDLSAALETLADLGVVDLDTDEDAGGLTVGLSRLGTWGVHGRLRARGWQLPVAGQLAQDRAAVLLAALADYDAEDGEAEIAAWLAERGPGDAATELMEAARQGSPGLRGAAFAVLDRVGDEAIPSVSQALDEPMLRPHAAVWLRDHGEPTELARGDQEWLLVDLGAGLLEEAQPEDVVAELLPDLPSGGQANLVAGLWEVGHPGLIGLLTALGEHHHDPAVAKAARKAALKARSRAATGPAREASQRPSPPDPAR
ncbi:MAG TPA: hypothetical protein VHY58_11960 [Streptosporangiaceae bacterium]|nr:hypothetical protein [Streptosporangiaceae bacterium]